MTHWWDRICEQKASSIDAFFCVRLLVILLTGSSSLFHSENTFARACTSPHFDETATVEYVHDGDSLRLSDGRKVRIIGINTPELAREDNPAEPYALRARDHLRGLLKPQSKIKLRWGRERKDRYGRTLAHVFLSNGENVSQRLLTEGLAMALTVPPNLWQWDCYQLAEQNARKSKRGLWSHQRFQISAAKHLDSNTRGFRQVSGVVKRVGFSKSSIWLNLDANFAIRIKRSDLEYFNGVDFRALRGRKLVARGWVKYHNNQLRMRVRHPAALKIE